MKKRETRWSDDNPDRTRRKKNENSPVLRIDADGTEALYDAHAGRYASEDGMFIVEIGSRRKGDEELRTWSWCVRLSVPELIAGRSRE